eukprot:scaffold4002_cov126-Skeletonema_dohrnii-CCMP3373.AAC.2
MDVPLRKPKEVSPRQRRKSLAQRLEEQDRELQQLSFEEVPFGLQHQSKLKDEYSCPHMLDQEDVGNNSLNSCPATLSASGALDDEDLLDSPMTHPPRTVIVRTGDLHGITTPRKKNSIHRKRLFSIDFSTICTEREEEDEGLLGEEEDLSVEEDTSVDRNDDDDDDHEKDDDDDDDDNDDDDEWDDTATFSTYPPTSIMLVPNNHLDAIATPHRSRMYRGYSDLSSTCSSHGHNSSFPPLPLLSLPKLEEPELWAQDEYGPLYKPDEDDETDEDEDQIPHVMSCPDMLGDSEEDEDDVSDLPYAESHSLYVHSIESASCPGRLFTEGSIASAVL